MSDTNEPAQGWPDYSTPESRAAIDDQYTYHPPRPAQVDVYQEVRATMGATARYLDRVLPPSDEKREALALVDVATMRANAAIARQQ